MSIAKTRVDPVAMATKKLKVVISMCERSWRFKAPPLPEFMNVMDIKKFVTAINENRVVSGWRRSSLRFVSGSDKLVRSPIGRREYAALGHTLFLFRKTLPSPEPDIPHFLDSMTVADEADPVFVAKAIEIVKREFPVGWDRKFRKNLDTMTIGLKSFYQKKVKPTAEDLAADPHPPKTAREYIIRRFNREEFVSFILGGGLPIKGTRRVAVVKEGGKTRVVTIADAFQYAFAPFSSCFYNFLSKKSWLLRGEARASSFREFRKSEGEVFVSGDYESATDSLNRAHSKAILSAVLGQCRHLPDHYAEALSQSLDSVLVHEGKSYVTGRGQLMGDKLSFPLLCLYNFVAFKSIVSHNVPLKINGDDIAFRARKEEAQAWLDRVSSTGLKLCVGKTSVHDSIFSLNSSLFVAKPSGTEQLSFIRSKPFFGASGRLEALTVGDRFRSSLVGHWCISSREFAFSKFVTFNRGWLRKSQVSLVRGHKIRVRDGLLRSLNLWKAECHYRALPVPEDRLRLSVGVLPAGVVNVPLNRETKRIGKENRSVISERFVEHSWSPLSLPESESSVRGSSFPYVDVAGRNPLLVRVSRDSREAGNTKSWEERIHAKRVARPPFSRETVMIPIENVDKKRDQGEKRGLGYRS
jgi:hypothetical protein